jgi:hypothetical protein
VYQAKRVLGQAAIADLQVPELVFVHSERVLNLGADLHFDALDLVDQLAVRSVLVKFLATLSLRLDSCLAPELSLHLLPVDTPLTHRQLKDLSTASLEGIVAVNRGAYARRHDN